MAPSWLHGVLLAELTHLSGWMLTLLCGIQQGAQVQIPVCTRHTHGEEGGGGCLRGVELEDLGWSVQELPAESGHLCTR